MRIFRKLLLPSLLILSLLANGREALAVGKATVTGQLETGFTGKECGGVLKINAVVTANNVEDPHAKPYGAVIPPRSASFRVYYTTDSLTFNGVEGVLLDTYTTYTQPIATVDAFRVYRIVRAAKHENLATTGTLLRCVFTLNSNGYKPYSVEFADDLTTNTPLMGFDYEITPWINEIHYDDTGADANEGIEIAGAAGMDLAGWYIYYYDGATGAYYNYTQLSGVLTNQNNGYGTKWFARSGMQDGAPDGLALINPNGEVVQFLSYEGSFTATNELAQGMTSTDIGVSEPGTDADGRSLQLSGTGTKYSDFTWNAPAVHTRNLLNTGQTFGSTAPTIVLWDEVDMFNDYDNTAITNIGSDTTTSTACGLSTVSTEVVTSGPCQFVVYAKVTENTSNQIPQAFAFKVIYDTASVTYKGFLPGQLGTVMSGSEKTISGTLKYRRLSSLGSTNSNPLPTCLGLVFEENIGGARPYEIQVIGDDTPGASPLVSRYTFKSMYSIFDSSESTSYQLAPPCKVLEWMLLDNSAPSCPGR